MSSYVVTGAARGLGFEFIKQLSTPVDNVVFALVRSAKTTGKLEALARPNVHIIEADITDVTALKLAAQKVAEITGRKLDVLINNAAFIEYERYNLRLYEYPEGQEALLEEDLRKTFNINVIAAFMAMVASFRKVYPDFSGPITPEESVTAMRKVIGEITVESTGAFISHKGNKEWL